MFHVLAILLVALWLAWIGENFLEVLLVLVLCCVFYLWKG